ncbi:hypothetical protein H4R33_001347 [Dimargaris cristalligena]|nr:hypothetical protein H4R33_001347 [Dimargaris cristalligena]
MASPDPLVAQLADVLDLLTQARTSQARHWSMHDIRRFEATCRHVAQTFTTTTTTTGAQQQDLYHYLTGEPVLNDPLDNRDSNPRLLGFSDSEAADRWDGGQSASVLDIVSQMVEDLDTDQSTIVVDDSLPDEDKGPKTVSVSTGPARPSSEQRLWLLDHGPFVPARVARRNPWFAEFYSTWLRQFISKSGPDENSGKLHGPRSAYTEAVIHQQVLGGHIKADNILIEPADHQLARLSNGGNLKGFTLDTHGRGE